MLSFNKFYLQKSNLLHAVFLTRQGRQREPSVETLGSPLFAEFWRHCFKCRKTPRFASTPRQRNVNKCFISSTGYRTRRVYTHTLCSCATIGLTFHTFHFIFFFIPLFLIPLNRMFIVWWNINFMYVCFASLKAK